MVALEAFQMVSLGMRQGKQKFLRQADVLSLNKSFIDYYD